MFADDITNTALAENFYDLFRGAPSVEDVIVALQGAAERMATDKKPFGDAWRELEFALRDASGELAEEEDYQNDAL